MTGVTEYFLIASVVVWIIYDVYVFVFDRENDSTISEVMWRVSRDYPIVPFAVGVIMGHWFWPAECI